MSEILQLRAGAFVGDGTGGLFGQHDDSWLFIEGVVTAFISGLEGKVRRRGSEGATGIVGDG